MYPPEFYSLFDRVSIFFGVSLFYRKTWTWTRFVTWIRALTIIALNIFKIADVKDIDPDEPSPTKYLLFAVHVVTKSVMGTIYVIWMNYHSDRLGTLLSMLIKELRHQQKVKVQRIVNIGLTIMVIRVLYYVTGSLVMFFVNPAETKEWYDWEIWEGFWVEHAIVVYVTFVATFYESRLAYLEEIAQELAVTQDRDAIGIYILLQLKKSRNDLDTLNHLLGLIPLFMFSELFLAIPGMVNGFDGTLLIGYYIVEMPPLVVYIVSLIFCVIFIDRKRKQVEDASNSVIRLIMLRQKPTLRWTYLTAELSDPSSTIMSACSLFNLRSEVIISFIGGLVSFTVLLLQLQDVVGRNC